MSANATTAQSQPFALAKQALGYVGEYQTPPTPKVYEVWYRYAEGKNESIRQQLDHAINEAQSVSVAFLEQLHDQFCSPTDKTNDRVSLELTNELVKLRSLISTQMSAGEDFNSSINSASEAFSPASEVSTTEIAARIGELLESNQTMQTELHSMGSRLHESQSQVEDLRKDLIDSQKTMMTDPLTGVGNRRFFDTMLQQAVNQVDNEVGQVYLLLIDLDEFKLINDTFGHVAGDQVLKFVASETTKLRPDVSIARYGGDEFAVFLHTDDVDDATEYADNIRRFFSTNSLRLARSKESIGRVSISIGVARLRAGDDGNSWFERADQLLYRAKESGRNCVMVERSIDM